MVMEKYGQTLRKIRLQKGYTLQQLANGILSVSFLSKFERGESEISLHNFVQLLNRLAVSFDEFFHLHHGVLETFETFFDEADEAFVNRDFTTIRRLRKVQHEKWQDEQMDQYLCNTVMLDIYDSILSNEIISAEDEAVKTLNEYLFNAEVWGNYEMRLYNSTMLSMPLEMVLVLSKTAFEKGYEYRGMRESKKMLTGILLNTLIYLTGGEGKFRYVEEVEQFFKYIEKLGIPENDLYSRNFFMQVKGIYEIRKGNREKGMELVQQASKISSQLGSNFLAKQIDAYLDIVLEKES